MQGQACLKIDAGAAIVGGRFARQNLRFHGAKEVERYFPASASLIDHGYYAACRVRRGIQATRNMVQELIFAAFSAHESIETGLQLQVCVVCNIVNPGGDIVFHRTASRSPPPLSLVSALMYVRQSRMSRAGGRPEAP